jgi:hypothetical protein
MIAMEMPGRLLHAGLLAALLALGACGREPEVAAVGPEDPALPPPIVAPTENPDLPSPPSYEVGIATAAADRNRAREKCAEKSERLRAMCEAEADAAFAAAQENLSDLRGNQQ